MNKPTRIAITAILAAALALPVIAQATRFPDVPATHFRQADIQAVASRGWFIGKADGTYDPEGAITSGQMARVIGRRFPNGMTRAEFASLLLVANQWAQNGKPTFTGAPTTTTTRPAPTTTTTRPAPTTTTRPTTTTTELFPTAEREELLSLLDSPLWSTSPTNIFNCLRRSPSAVYFCGLWSTSPADVFDWSNEQIITIGEAGLEDIREMLAEARRIDEKWAAVDTLRAASRMGSWWDDAERERVKLARAGDSRVQRPQLEEIFQHFKDELYWLDWGAWTLQDSF